MPTEKQQFATFEKEVNAIVDDAVKKLSRLIGRSTKKGGFDLSHPSIKPHAAKILKEFYRNLNRFITATSNQRWVNAERILKAKVNDVAVKSGMTEAAIRSAFAYNPIQFKEFIARTQGGKQLSDRVWNITKQLRFEFEYAVDIGIRNGIPAAEISRDIRKYLKEPNKLFRRVRGDDGKLRLSKAAKAYKPGRGVYRSSYKNAMRLARTETNMAFHEATFKKVQTLDFVVGIRIETSTNHPIPDMCDLLAGEYPKDFKFTNWHPNCRCHEITIHKTDAEFLKGKDWKGVSVNTVKDVPEAFKNYVRNSSANVKKTYFWQDNQKYVSNL